MPQLQDLSARLEPKGNDGPTVGVEFGHYGALSEHPSGFQSARNLFGYDGGVSFSPKMAGAYLKSGLKGTLKDFKPPFPLIGP